MITTHTHTKSQDQRLIAFKSYSRNSGRTDTTDSYTLPRAALTGKHDTLVRRAPGWQGAPDGQQAKKLVVTKCAFYCKINIL